VTTTTTTTTSDVRPSRTLLRLQAQLRSSVGKAIADFGMITAGDRVMVCLSGGKDSYTLLDILISLQRSAPVPFELIAVNLDQKQPGFPEHVLPEYLTRLQVPFRIIEQDTYSVVKRVIPEGRTMCGLCSRLRRGALYRFAAENGCTKIALGHHRDDIVETLFLNLFFGGRLKAMAPKLLSDDGRQIVIRPLAYVAERDIARYARGRNFPIIPCTLCGSQDNMQRVIIKKMLAEWERDFPGRTESIFSALRHVETEHLADPRRFDFAGLEASRQAQMSDGSDVAAATEMGTSEITGATAIAANVPMDGMVAMTPMAGMTAMTEAEETALETRLDSAPAFA
jgi:tRNA 2-thiocytidine biosynthesis protein TtcA